MLEKKMLNQFRPLYPYKPRKNDYTITKIAHLSKMMVTTKALKPYDLGKKGNVNVSFAKRG